MCGRQAPAAEVGGVLVSAPFAGEPLDFGVRDQTAAAEADRLHPSGIEQPVEVALEMVRYAAASGIDHGDPGGRD